jgi:hypothetical protein
VWRIAFAFDPKRQAILLVGGNKAGADQRRLYKRLISVADARFDEYLAELKEMVKERKHGKKLDDILAKTPRRAPRED